MLKAPEAKQFWLVRYEDESGVSGVGIVAEGTQYTTGVCTLSWLTDYESVGVYPSLEELRRIHGHEGKTSVVWLEPPEDYSNGCCCYFCETGEGHDA